MRKFEEKKPIKFEFYERETITDEELNKLSNQGVCTDDWDYMIFIEQKINIQEIDGFEITLKPLSYNLCNLLRGCCTNTWYEVKNFYAKSGILGVAYHS